MVIEYHFMSNDLMVIEYHFMEQWSSGYRVSLYGAMV